MPTWIPVSYTPHSNAKTRSNWVDPSIKTGPTGMPRDPPVSRIAAIDTLLGPSTDRQLAQYGENQSVALAEYLSTASPRPERVFSSAFYRCIQTAIPTAQKLNVPVSLDHGVGEWYSTVNPDTGLHPRPSSVTHLARYFPDKSLDMGYTPTVFPSRRGESLKDLQDRADLFIESWTSRVESEYPGVKAVVIFAHAASVIALGRAVSPLPISRYSH